MPTNTSPIVLIVPGLRDHVEQHWQTILAKQLTGTHTVPPLEQNKLSRAARVAALNDALEKIEGPVILVAHSAGVMIVAHWAQQYQRPILGALLATPAYLESPLPAGYPAIDDLRENGWLPIPRTPLPFPSILAASSNDPLCDFNSACQLSQDWGSRLVNLGAVGHLNPAAGFGVWNRAQEFILELS